MENTCEKRENPLYGINITIEQNKVHQKLFLERRYRSTYLEERLKPNYRPVTFLPVLSKLMEAIVTDSLMRLLEGDGIRTWTELKF